MGQHQVQSDLEGKQIFKSAFSGFESPEGLCFGFGTTVGNGIEGWAPNALFLDTNANAGTGLLLNYGTKTAANFERIIIEKDTGSVTQITSKSTGVTVNAYSGIVIMHNAALAAGAEVTFVVSNTRARTGDVIALSIGQLNATAGAYTAQANEVGTNTFSVTLSNVTGGSLSEAVQINFAILKII